MHVCFALMVGVPLTRLCAHRGARICWTVYPLLVGFVIVTTANHFLAAPSSAPAPRSPPPARRAGWAVRTPPPGAGRTAGRARR